MNTYVLLHVEHKMTSQSVSNFPEVIPAARGCVQHLCKPGSSLCIHAWSAIVKEVGKVSGYMYNTAYGHKEPRRGWQTEDLPRLVDRGLNAVLLS